MSDMSRGSGWVMEVMKGHFGVRGQIMIKPFAADRGLLFVEDDRARMRITDRGWIIENGIQISCAPWRSEVTHLRIISSNRWRGGTKSMPFLYTNGIVRTSRRLEMF